MLQKEAGEAVLWRQSCSLPEEEAWMKSLLLVLLCTALLGCRTNESPEAQVDDLKITTQVKSKLASDIGLSSVTNISVNSTNGVVTLSGQVDSQDVKTKAEAVARGVPKVVRVVDSLQVSPKTTAIPRAIWSSICGLVVFGRQEFTPRA
jgi:hypothetical protein